MAFDREENLVKESIQDFHIVFFIPGALNVGGVQSGEVTAQIRMSNGEIQVRTFNLLDRLGDDAAGQTHLANLASLRDYIRTRLENEVLPV